MSEGEARPQIIKLARVHLVNPIAELFPPLFRLRFIKDHVVVDQKVWVVRPVEISHSRLQAHGRKLFSADFFDLHWNDHRRRLAL
jgi:uncharacterized protein with NAD-binding domain and iron-sulfur cluster